MFQSNLKGTDARDKKHTNKGAIVGYMKETPKEENFSKIRPQRVRRKFRLLNEFSIMHIINSRV
jgi:hypothetical protein